MNIKYIAYTILGSISGYIIGTVAAFEVLTMLGFPVIFKDAMIVGAIGALIGIMTTYYKRKIHIEQVKRS